MAELATTARPYARAAFANAAATRRSWRLGRIPRACRSRGAGSAAGAADRQSARAGSRAGRFAAGARQCRRPGQPRCELQQRNFLQLLADNRRLRLLPEIAAQFEALRAEAERIADVEVISAQQLHGRAGAATAGGARASPGTRGAPACAGGSIADRRRDRAPWGFRGRRLAARTHRAPGRGDERRLTNTYQGFLPCPSSHPKSAT